MLKHIQWFYPQNCPSCVVLQFKSLNTFCRFKKKKQCNFCSIIFPENVRGIEFVFTTE